MNKELEDFLKMVEEEQVNALRRYNLSNTEYNCGCLDSTTRLYRSRQYIALKALLVEESEGWICWEPKGNNVYPKGVTAKTLVDIKDFTDLARDCCGIAAEAVWWSCVKAYRLAKEAPQPQKQTFREFVGKRQAFIEGHAYKAVISPDALINLISEYMESK